MASKSGAGAAVSSGANFQARVGGYVIVTTICEVQNLFIAEGNILTIGFETTENVDDINLRTSDGSVVYIQAKARIEYSISSTGELRSVIDQFCLQQKENPSLTDQFVLVTTSRSSKKITYDLRTALDTFKMSPEHEFFRDQPKALTSLIHNLRDTIAKSGAYNKGPYVPGSIDHIIRKMSVVILDIEAGDPLEQSLELVMAARNFVSVSSVWGKVIADCVVHSKNRHTLRISDAIADYDKFRMKEEADEPEVAKDLISLEIDSMDFSVGKEVVLCRVEENWADIPTGLVVLELYRFSDDCSQRVSFQLDKIVLNNGLEFQLLRRSATVQGLMRTIDADLIKKGNEQIVICPIQSEADFEVGLCADIHRERLRAAVERNKSLLNCS